MAISVFSVLTAAYYQNRLDRARAIAGIMRDGNRSGQPPAADGSLPERQ